MWIHMLDQTKSRSIYMETGTFSVNNLQVTQLLSKQKDDNWKKVQSNTGPARAETKDVGQQR